MQVSLIKTIPTIRVTASRYAARIEDAPHHWALDAGLFTLTSDYAIVVSPLARRADSRKFELLSLDGKRMQVPRRDVIAPHRAALEWHQINVFRG